MTETGQLGLKHISADNITQAALAKLPKTDLTYLKFSPDAAKLAVRAALLEGYEKLVTSSELAAKVNEAKNTATQVVSSKC
ncbi:MAG UNVERIFIED_CONTAM: hypothetical protein LVQ98_03215 [Rickettsiaceae bacterium]